MFSHFPIFSGGKTQAVGALNWWREGNVVKVYRGDEWRGPTGHGTAMAKQHGEDLRVTHGKTRGKPEENQRIIGGFMGFYGDSPSGNLLHSY